MLRDLFQSMKGVEHFGLISTLIFVLFFAGVVLHSVSMKKKDVEDFSRMPFDDSTKDSDDV
jgi:hypothetical protein